MFLCGLLKLRDVRENMEKIIKPIVVVSKCIEFDHCRYNEQIIKSTIVNNLKSYVKFKPICPEVEIGLGIPRKPLRLVKKDGIVVMFQPATENEYTEKMKDFSKKFIKTIGDVDGFILKNSSPSCGINNVKIYNSLKKGASASRGKGIFGEFIINNYKGLPIEDEGRLNNMVIRENFLIRLFLLTKFRIMKKHVTINKLIDFHSRNKYLLMAYNQSKLKELGQIVANHNKKENDEVFSEYEVILKKAVEKPFKINSIINSVYHCFGGVSKDMSKEEKAFFIETVEEYRDERIPFSTVAHLLKSYAVRFNKEYLLNQTLLNPYPDKLQSIHDTGKSRRYSTNIVSKFAQ